MRRSPRLPERYPLTTYYYRELMGCPQDSNIIKCYYEAKPGDTKGKLGFDLVAVFDTFPKLGNFEINDQYAEEAFTFYDHPKVLIFKKNENFNSTEVQNSLSSVDLTKAVHLSRASSKVIPTSCCPRPSWPCSRASGTWSQLFDYNWAWNKYPVLGLLIWYIFIFILGLAVYPLVRLAMPGLADKGYPLSRALGLVLFGYLAWIGGCARDSLYPHHDRHHLCAAPARGGWAGLVPTRELRQEWREKRKFFLMIEGTLSGVLPVRPAHPHREP